MEIVALISIVSVLAWFLLGARNRMNFDSDTEAEPKEK
jgi:hypothetical protein